MQVLTEKLKQNFPRFIESARLHRMDSGSISLHQPLSTETFRKAVRDLDLTYRVAEGNARDDHFVDVDGVRITINVAKPNGSVLSSRRVVYFMPAEISSPDIALALTPEQRDKILGFFKALEREQTA